MTESNPEVDENSEEEMHDDSVEGITVTYTATLHYEPWEVSEFDITPQAAIENLMTGLSQSPSNWGEIDVERTETNSLEE